VCVGLWFVVMVVVLVVLVVLSEARSTCGAVFSRSASFALFWSVGIEVTMMVADQGAPQDGGYHGHRA